MIDKDGFTITVRREEWRVVAQEVDQYGRDSGEQTVLSAWPSYELARADLPNHADESEYVAGRWIPKSARHGYVVCEVRHASVLVTDPEALREALDREDEVSPPTA